MRTGAVVPFALVHADEQSSQTPPSLPINPNPRAQSHPDTTALDPKKEKDPIVSVTPTDGPEEDSSCDSSGQRGIATEGTGPAHNPSDVWSVAYREAVASLGTDIDITILKADSVADLFRQLEQVGKDATQESVFWRGVRYLQTLQVPLEKFKLALDLADPLTSIDAKLGSVFGVVKTVTAVCSPSYPVLHADAQVADTEWSIPTDCHQPCKRRCRVRQTDWRHVGAALLH